MTMSSADPRIERLRGMVDDFHTHIPATPRAIISTSPADPRPDGFLYSVGIHPWDADKPDDKDTENDTEKALAALALAAEADKVVAIGECGLDRLRGPELARQLPLFERQLDIAERLDKPVIIHCVRCFDTLLALAKRRRPRVPWIVHGFRGKPELARQLIAAGMYLSLSAAVDPARYAPLPASRLLRETDAMPPVLP